MRHQRVLNELSIFRLTLRKMGLLYFVPHIFLYVLIPLLGIGYLLYHGDGANARGLIFYDFQKRSLLAEFWLMFSWYILHVAVLFLAFGIFLENYWRDYPLIVTQALAFASVAFCLLCATQTLMVPFLLTLLYEIFGMLSNFGVLEWVNLFSLQRMENFLDFLIPYSIVFAFSCAVPFLGNYFYKKRK